ncbi:MAG: hypothetical protein J6A37_14435 [Oscillospiraceae bacterium]|nr:hypothetical protein [Oscillospiraceae bacterium]
MNSTITYSISRDDLNSNRGITDFSAHTHYNNSSCLCPELLIDIVSNIIVCEYREEYKNEED